MKKCLSLLAFLFLFNSVLYSQADENFHVKTFQPEKYADQVSLFVKADKKSLQEYLENHEGKYKYSSGGYHGITLPSIYLKDLLSKTFVKGSDFSIYRPTLMNDTMRLRDNINPVHDGVSPLDTSYTGKGVLIGMIDTGLDLNHLDFRDANGNTRVYKVWDQTYPFDAQQTPAFYGYGQAWDSVEINDGNCPSTDMGGGHGTTVTGTASGNGLANGRHKGVAPEATLVIVRTNTGSGNWLGTVADAVDYIFKVADTLQMPVVINASVGTYYGSHDGRDPNARFIDSLIAAKPGRLMVCAAGNSGNIGSYHLRHDTSPLDTNFTWFRYNASSAFGYGAVFFEGYADTVDLNSMNYAIGVNLNSGSYSDRGQTSFINVNDHLDTTYTESILSGTDTIATVDFYAELRDDIYFLQVHIKQPDSSDYNFRFMTAGQGAIDIWTTSVFGTSNMVNVPAVTSATLPEIVNYVSPDSLKIIVSSFSCGYNTILVGNYYAMQQYTDYNGNLQVLGGTNGNISINSSRGPSRDFRIKPEIAASGDVHMSAGPLAMITSLIVSEPHKVDQGGMHIRNGGTSMASPVVTGIAALALQKCPNLTSSEFREMITQTAKMDSFTGAVPNVSYGHGKVDAFAALVESNFTIGVGLNTSLCPGDSVELLIGPGPLYDFLWSTGDTTATIWATDSAYFSVEAHNEFGCKGKIDSIQTSIYPEPNVTITIDSSAFNLIASPSLTYQWLFEGDTLPGETNQTLNFITIGNGTFHVYITDANGCVGSEMIYVIIDDVIENENEIISVYPNPTTSDVFITAPSKLISVSVMDASGKLVFIEDNLNKNIHSVNLQNFERGIYFIEVKTEEGNGIVRVVRE